MFNQIKHLTLLLFDFAWICKPGVIVFGDGQTATAVAATTTTTTTAYIVGIKNGILFDSDKYKRAVT